MHMFIANGSHQNIDFQYRLPNTRTYRTQMISIGQQIRLSGDLTKEEVDIIIKHHSIYGMVPATQIQNFKGFFIPYAYSTDNPVSAETIIELVLQNREYNKQLGIRLRQEAAVTVSNQIEENTTDTLKTLEMTIEEVPSKERDATFSEGIRVTRMQEKGAPQGPIEFPRKIARPQF